MKWAHIISEVFILYFKCLVIYFAYHLAKVFTAMNRSSLKPPITEKIVAYLKCATGVFFIALLASGNFGGDNEEDGHLVSMDYNRGATVFIALIIPALIGATQGYTSNETYKSSGSHLDDDMM